MLSCCSFGQFGGAACTSELCCVSVVTVRCVWLPEFRGPTAAAVPCCSGCAKAGCLLGSSCASLKAVCIPLSSSAVIAVCAGPQPGDASVLSGAGTTKTPSDAMALPTWQHLHRSVCMPHHFHSNAGGSSIQRCGAALYVYKHACVRHFGRKTALLLYITFGHLWVFCSTASTVVTREWCMTTPSHRVPMNLLVI